MKIDKILFSYRYKVKKLITKYQIWVEMLEKSPYNEAEIRIYKRVISDLKNDEQLTKQN